MMKILKKICTQIIMLSNWLVNVLFWASMPYFSYTMMQNSRKFPTVSSITRNKMYKAIVSGWSGSCIFLGKVTKLMALPKFSTNSLLLLLSKIWISKSRVSKIWISKSRDWSADMISINRMMYTLIIFRNAIIECR